ncbi:MAG: hypothetical protein AUI14_13030 [Actinobacteria bacterium 13_2_20CM_2_71_6]|nr:MAG: hypothetical protein AUI14_13030 [Actinobacteria bacterium 13_2_20CM_2_71_6]
MMLGVLSDAWAHNNILKTLESFFTPWHALLYTGFGATGAWTFFLAYRRRHVVPEWWRDGWPAGYRLGALGVVIFLLAGGGDMVWHTVFGIEANLAAGLSPTHLILAVGATLLLTSPLRSWWADGAGGGLRAATGVAGLVLGTTVVSIFMTYGLAFYPGLPLQPYHAHTPTANEALQASLGAASYVVTTALLVVPLLFVHRRRATPGIATALVAAVALFVVASREFPTAVTVAAFAAIVAAALVDVVLVRLDKIRGDDAVLRLPIAGAVFAALVWPAHLLGLQLGGGIRWPAELWAGIVVITIGVGALLGGLATRPAQMSRM